ncbi:deoxyguanosinetriphosphate triphosphohydrolase [Candidatus Peregrinibacteria bacterium]|nr:deoxyguanosinetriphosphate triphosphohydrolase [Candidatus Peregrinibacteria bacterium]
MTFLLTRQDLENRELHMLPPYAIRNVESKGRDHEELKSPTRLEFQRDRDRVLHSKAFRRLKGKTQVFVAHYGDHFRSRLTHTLEVAQIARSLARILQGNEDLSETIALAHDLGHTPFGHAGEEAMRELMHRFGLDFEHNAQSRRIVEILEKRNPNYDGLNLTKESREGLFKHVSPHDRQKHKLAENAFLEAQIVDSADQIAYQNHDIDDGLRSGILSLDDLSKLDIWQKVMAKIPSGGSEEVWISRLVSGLINEMVENLSKESARKIAELKPKTPDDIRNSKEKIVGFSQEMEDMNTQLRHFLFSCFYKSSQVIAQSTNGKETIKKLFFYLYDHPESLPENYYQLVQFGERKEVVLKDFIAGMTDDFALNLADSLS